MTDYDESIADWQARRFAHLTAEDGWLNVIGRYWLEDGDATIGSEPGSDIVLPVGPARLGTVMQQSGRVSFTPADGGATVELTLNPANPPKFSVGNLRFEITTLDGRNALRGRDVDAPARHNFKGLTYFPTNPAWRIAAQWQVLDRPISMGIDMVSSVQSTVTITHVAVMTHNGVRYELLPTHGTAEKPQFVIRDLTSRDQTYGASRFLYGEAMTANSIVLDFNKAFNPPCAFTDYAVCPLPPPQNILPFRIEAGEKKPN